MNTNEMVGTFDFMDINDDEVGVELEVNPRTSRGSNIHTDDNSGFDMDMVEDEEGFDEFEDDEVEEESFEDTTSITEALGQLNAIADDYELDFGSQKVSKGELVKLLGDRETIVKTREAIDGLGSRMAGRENDIELFYSVAKTETDKQLDNVYAMLNDPSKWNSNTDVAQLQRARIQLEGRKAELDKSRETAMASMNAQKQELDNARIQRVVAEMGSHAPLQEAAKYAESKGIDLNAIVAGASPALVLALQNAKKYEELVNKNKTRINQTAAQRKARSTPVKAKVSGKMTQNDRDRAWAQHKAGKLDHAAMFNFLAD